MTEPSTAATGHYDAEHMRAIQTGLAACGLTTHLTDARAGLDLTATLSPSRMRKAEFWVDDEGYAELRYWYPPGTPPAEITAALRALQAVTTPPDPGPCPTSGSPSSRLTSHCRRPGNPATLTGNDGHPPPAALQPAP